MSDTQPGGSATHGAAESALPALLLVDDRPENLLALEATLAMLPAHLVRASSGEQALHHILQRDFAAVLLDVDLGAGRMDGFETARLIRERGRSSALPILFLTAHSGSVAQVEQGYAAGGVDFLIKPFPPSVLRAKVSVFIELYRAREEVRRQAEVIRAQERALSERSHRERLEALFLEVPAGIAILRGPDLVFEFASPLYEKLVGCRVVRGRSLQDTLPEVAAQNSVMSPLREVLASGRPFRARELPLKLDPAGEGRADESFFDVSFLPMHDSAGHVDGIHVFAVEVTEQVQARHVAEEMAASLRDSEEQFRTFFGLAGVPMAQTDSETGRLVRVNSALCTLLGYPEEEVLGRSLESFTHPEDRWADVARPVATTAEDAPLRVLEKRLVRKDGRVRWVLATSNPVRAPHGRVERVATVLQDVTERHEAEAARRASEELLRTVVDALPALVAFIDTGLRYRLLNHAYEVWHGADPANMVGRTLEEVLGPAAVEAIRPRMLAALAGEPQHYDAELEFRRVGRRHVRISYVPHRLPDGRVDGLVVLGTDITEEVQRGEERAQFLSAAEAARRRAEDLALELDSLFANAPAGLALLDEQQRFVRVNDALAASMGMEAGALLGCPPSEVLSGPGATMEEMARRVLTTGQAISEVEVVGRAPGSMHEHVWRADYYPVRDTTERLRGTGVVMLEVTQTRRAQTQLERLQAVTSTLSAAPTEEEVARGLLEEAVGGLGAGSATLFLREPDGSLRLLHALGLSPSALVSVHSAPADSPAAEVVRTREPLWFSSRQALLARFPSMEETITSTRNESWAVVPLLSRGEPQGVCVVAFSQPRIFGQDERAFLLAMGQQGAQALERARLYHGSQAAVRLRDEFLSVASHELRTPITSLKLQLQLVSRALPPADDVVRMRLVAAERQVGRLASLVESLLDVSRLGEGRLELHLAEVDLVALAAETIERMGSLFEAARSTVSLEAPDGPVRGRWDAQRLDQVLVNILSNAAKYGAGQPVRVQVRRVEQRAILEVRDEGIGIEADALPRLFGRFERAVSERHYGGMGLGLYISRQLVDALGGDIRVVSEPGSGAVFTVELPLAGPAGAS